MHFVLENLRVEDNYITSVLQQVIGMLLGPFVSKNNENAANASHNRDDISSGDLSLTSSPLIDSAPNSSDYERFPNETTTDQSVPNSSDSEPCSSETTADPSVPNSSDYERFSNETTVDQSVPNSSDHERFPNETTLDHLTPVIDLGMIVPSHDSPLTSAIHQSNQQFQLQHIQVHKPLHKCMKRALAIFYLVLEAISFVLDLVGKSKKRFLLAAFLLSAFGFAMTIRASIMGRTPATTGLQAQRQLIGSMEIIFSAVQLIVSLIHFILVYSGVQINYSASVFPLVFAMIVVVFAFKNEGGSVTNSSRQTYYISSADSPVNPLINYISSSPSNGTMVGHFNNSVSDLSIISSLSSPMAPAAASRVHQQYQLQHVEVYMPETDVRRVMDLTMFTCYEDLYSEIAEMFNIEGELLGRGSIGRLVFRSHEDEDHEIINIDDPWSEFRTVVRNIYIDRRLILRNEDLVRNLEGFRMANLLSFYRTTEQVKGQDGIPKFL